MTKVIPEQRIFVCDRCHAEDPLRASDGELCFYRWLGESKATKTNFELCDACFHDAVNVVTGFMVEVGNEAKS